MELSQTDCSCFISTAESEFASIKEGDVEIIGGKQLMLEIDMQVKTPVVLRIDNRTAFQQMDNEAASTNKKRVDIILSICATTLRKAR